MKTTKTNHVMVTLFHETGKPDRRSGLMFETGDLSQGVSKHLLFFLFF